jgi:hypothetical protein
MHSHISTGALPFWKPTRKSSSVLGTAVLDPAKKSKQSFSLGDKNPQTNSAFQDDMTPRQSIHHIKDKRFAELCFVLISRISKFGKMALR